MDLIERQAAIDLVKSRSYDLSEREDEWAMVQDVEELPSAQPEIVRCRDCQNYDGGTCTRLLLRINDIRCTPYKPNDFECCSLAERRTDD